MNTHSDSLSAALSTAGTRSSRRTRRPGRLQRLTLVAMAAVSLSTLALAQYQDHEDFDLNTDLDHPYDVALFDPNTRVYDSFPQFYLGGTSLAFVSDPVRELAGGKLHQYQVDGRWLATYDENALGFPFDFRDGPYGVAVNDNPSDDNFGHIYVIGGFEQFNGAPFWRIRVYKMDNNRFQTSTYQKLEVVTDFFGRSPTDSLFQPKGLAVDSDGDVYVTTYDDSKSASVVLKFHGEDVSKYGGFYAPEERMYVLPNGDSARDVSVSSFDKIVTIASTTKVYRFQNNGTFIDSASPGTEWSQCSQEIQGVCARDLAGDLCGRVWNSVRVDGPPACKFGKVERRGPNNVQSLEFTAGGLNILEQGSSDPGSLGLEHARTWGFKYSSSGPFQLPTTVLCQPSLFVCNDRFTNANVTVLKDSPMESCPLPDDAVAWWPFDDWRAYRGSGAVSPKLNMMKNRINRDANGVLKSNNALIPLPPTVEGVVKTALGSKSNDEWVEVPDHPSVNFGTDDMTIEGWIRARPSWGIGVILDKRGLNSSGKDAGYAAYLHGGFLSFQSLVDGAAGEYSSVTSSAKIDDEKWHHFAIVFENTSPGPGTVEFFVDGEDTEPINNKWSVEHTGDLDNLSPLYILRHRPDFSDGLSGHLDELTLYRRALDRDEDIKPIHAAGCAGKNRPYRGARGQ